MAGTYSHLVYHIVFSTKNRSGFITTNLEEDLYHYIGGIIRKLEGVCIEINGMPDHVHILTKLPPKISISEALRSIKGSSSKWVNESKRIRPRFGWQDGYSIFAVSKSQINATRKYIREQRTHHKKTDFKTEFVNMLNRHEVEYDDRYLWG